MVEVKENTTAAEWVVVRAVVMADEKVGWTEVLLVVVKVVGLGFD